ncbi:hypothetical protein YC2023_048647 [Brassica napus]
MDDPTHTSLVPEKQETSPSACKSLEAERERVQREKVDLVCEWPARLRARAVAEASRFSVKAVRFLVSLSSPPRFALPELWFNPHPEALTRGVNRHQRWLDCLSKGAVVWRGKCGEVVFSSPGGGGYESSVVAGSCLWEVVGFFSIASSILSPGGEGFHSLASPALVELSGGLRGQKVEENWFRWRLSGFKLQRNEGFGGGATAASRFSDGQVEAKATRGALMIKFQHASRLLDAWAKRRRPARLGLSCLVWAVSRVVCWIHAMRTLKDKRTAESNVFPFSMKSIKKLTKSKRTRKSRKFQDSEKVSKETDKASESHLRCVKQQIKNRQIFTWEVT